MRLAVIGKLGWIKRQRARFEDQPRQSKRETVSGESHYFLGPSCRPLQAPWCEHAFRDVHGQDGHVTTLVAAGCSGLRQVVPLPCGPHSPVSLSAQTTPFMRGRDGITGETYPPGRAPSTPA